MPASPSATSVSTACSASPPAPCFTYLPIERGDTVDSSTVSEAIRALYKTGFFEDVRLDRAGQHPGRHGAGTARDQHAHADRQQGHQDRRPDGRACRTSACRGRNLRPPGAGPRHPGTDRASTTTAASTTSRSTRPSPASTATASTSPSTSTKARPPRIRHINLVGNENFEEGQLRERWESNESNWLSAGTAATTSIPREKLSGDLEKLNEYYLDRGYVDFSVDSTQVAISPDKTRHVRHRRHDRGRGVHPLRRSRSPATPCCRWKHIKTIRAGQGRPGLLARVA